MPVMSLGNLSGVLTGAPESVAWGSYRFREKSGATSATQLAAATCTRVNIKAAADNAGKVYLGNNSSLTKADGTSDDTTGLSLSAGECTGWFTCYNLQDIWINCDNAGDDILITYY